MSNVESAVKTAAVTEANSVWAKIVAAVVAHPKTTLAVVAFLALAFVFGFVL